MICHDYIETPAGRVLIVINSANEALIGLYFEENATQAGEGIGTYRPGGYPHIARQISEYFTGMRQSFDIALEPQGTEFQKRVWKALQNIPYGATISYKQLAENVGKPGAYRAVGSANGKNPICLLIPCHRVVASDGALGGYSGGLAVKQHLLALESAA